MADVLNVICSGFKDAYTCLHAFEADPQRHLPGSGAPAEAEAARCAGDSHGRPHGGHQH